MRKTSAGLLASGGYGYCLHTTSNGRAKNSCSSTTWIAWDGGLTPSTPQEPRSISTTSVSHRTQSNTTYLRNAAESAQGSVNELN